MRKEKKKAIEDSISSFIFENSEDIRTKIGEKIEVLKDTFKMMNNVQKALELVNNMLDESFKL